MNKDVETMYLIFQLAEHKPKTKVWNVRNKAMGLLGAVSWYGRWRAYCFYPEGNMIFDAGCLSDIHQFIKSRTQEHLNGTRSAQDEERSTS